MIRISFYSPLFLPFLQADNISSLEEPIWLGKGVLQLGKKDYERALQQFNTCLEKNSHNTPALIGKATVLYHKYPPPSSLLFLPPSSSFSPLPPSFPISSFPSSILPFSFSPLSLPCIPSSFLICFTIPLPLPLLC